ncbi:ABC transporter ATP-binding protein [Sphingomonas alpina]|uniref:ABC transporter ATP-binding protein n=1 Tax=Sphingomonas alpina TaxID=653931 RepID=UPI001E64F7AB|nr:ABC transporter ATP-binding protein [Sphingomonas alpina]
MNTLSELSVDTPLVELCGVSKSYDGVSDAVAGLDLTVRRGEFLTLLGPSGSGKTTTLMMLAGFEEASAGDIRLAGQSLMRKPPHRRNMGVVFQNYALFPHMTVAENLSFPLSVRGIRGAPAKERVGKALALVNLDGLGGRRINQLSGGQQQRVALARALIFDPDLVLMDEPLGALDRQLREKLQVEIKHIQRQTGVTVIYVTHDQSEALALSDRIAVFAGGRLQQLGSPRAIYDTPANAFVAGFIGENNAIDGTVMERAGDRCTVKLDGGGMVFARAMNDVGPGDRATVTIRPEHIATDDDAAALPNRLTATIDDRIYHGDHSKIYASLPGGARVTIRSPRARGGDRIDIGWAIDRSFAFAAGDTARVRGGGA